LKKWILAAVCAATLAFVGAASAAPATHYVSKTGADTGTCTSAPCLTIGYAVGQANAGDTISVATGKYTESVAVSKQLTLAGSGATIDAAGHDQGITILGAASAGTVVRGFTVRNAGLEAIFANQTSNLTIANNTLVDNDLLFGVPNSPCIGSLDDCGEALHLQTVTGSTITDNLVQDNVGGILLTDEEGPTSGNTIRNNQVLDNVLDCGITLASHWFSLEGPAAPGVSGVYQNHVLNNISNGNGAAGIGVFTGPPGAAAWGNVVSGNTAMNNGLPGVAIHSHVAFQNASGNVVVNNTLSGNGADDDALTPGGAGIVVFADINPGPFSATPIAHTTIAANRISNEDIGIYTSGAAKLSGLPSNKFDSTVGTPISIN
jgi:parallel beta-helix repeat protein